MHLRVLVLLLAPLFLSAVRSAEEKKPKTVVPPNPIPAKAGMEVGGWSLESWGNPGSYEKWTQGEQSALKLIYMAGEKDKTSFKHLTCFGADAAGKATFHVFVPMDCATLPSVGLAVSTTLGYIWHESKALPLKHGWNALEFPLASPNWKTQKTKWEFTAGIDTIKEIRAVNLIIHNTKDTGWLLVGGLHFAPDETGKKIENLIDDLLGEDFVARAKAEGDLVAIGRPALEALYQQRTTDRMEIILRVGAITRKIEAMEEELPKDNPELKEQILKQREEAFFNEANVRADFVLKGFKTEREKTAKLIKDAQDELARGRMEFAKLEYTAEEDKKAYKESLDKLERYAKSLEESLSKMPDPEAERIKQESMMNDPAKMEAAKKENEKMEAAKEDEEKKMAEKIEAERKADEVKNKPLEVPTLKPLKKKNTP